MAIPTWPASLPQKPLRDGFEESLAINTIATPMDAGPGKTRRRSAAQAPFPCTFVMTATQLAALETFIRDDLLGVRRFNFPHPRTGSTIEVRVVPDESGRYYSSSNAGGQYWHVGLSLVWVP